MHTLFTPRAAFLRFALMIVWSGAAQIPERLVAAERNDTEFSYRCARYAAFMSIDASSGEREIFEEATALLSRLGNQSFSPYAKRFHSEFGDILATRIEWLRIPAGELEKKPPYNYPSQNSPSIDLRLPQSFYVHDNPTLRINNPRFAETDVIIEYKKLSNYVAGAKAPQEVVFHDVIVASLRNQIKRKDDIITADLDQHPDLRKYVLVRAAFLEMGRFGGDEKLLANALELLGEEIDWVKPMSEFVVKSVPALRNERIKWLTNVVIPALEASGDQSGADFPLPAGVLVEDSKGPHESKIWVGKYQLPTLRFEVSLLRNPKAFAAIKPVKGMPKASLLVYANMLIDYYDEAMNADK